MGKSEDTSQRTENWRKGTKTTDRDGLESMDLTEGQAACRAGHTEKLKPRAERSGWRIGKEMAEEGLKGLERVSAMGTRTMSLVNSEM